MALLDRRVLIDAPPEVVWAQISDLAALPRWHVNFVRSSILTTHQRGVGVRRRNTMKNDRSIVEEIVSWYEGLGYEYVVVDGAPYRRNRGLIRLQAIPEGTLVQWTFDYQLSGFLAGLRDRLIVKRRQDQEIADSLNKLKRLISATGIHMDAVSRDKVSMRPAPNADERAALAARVANETQVTAAASTPPRSRPSSPPTQRNPALVIEEDLPPLMPSLDEPPVAEEDTRPRPAIKVEPQEITRPVVPPDDAQFRPRQPAAPEPTATAVPPAPVSEDFLFRRPVPPAAEVKPEGEPEFGDLPPLDLGASDDHSRATVEMARVPASEPPPAEVEFEAEPEFGDLLPLDLGASDDHSRATVEMARPVIPSETPPAEIELEEEAVSGDLQPLEPEPPDSHTRKTVEMPRPAFSEEAPAAGTESAPEQPSTPRRVEPVGPSIWEVFGVPRPDEFAAEPPPQSQQETAPGDNNREIGGAQPAETTEETKTTPAVSSVARLSGGLRARRRLTSGAVRARAASENPGLRRKLIQQHTRLRRT